MSASGELDKHNESRAPGPGVVTGRSGSIGKVFYVEPDFWPLNTTLYVKDFHGNYPRFIFYLLVSFDLERFSSGAGVPTLNRNSFHQELVWIPSSTEEQKRIVAILDEAFAGIETAIANTEKNLANAQELFEGYLNSIFNERNESWLMKPLRSVTTKIGSGATPRGGQSAYKDSGVPLIRSLNIYDRRFKSKKLAFIDDEQADHLSNAIVEDRDVLFNITGASIARCCVAPTTYIPARVNQHVSILRPIQSELHCDFLCYMLTSRIYKDHLLGIGDEGGSTRQAITKSQLQNLTVGLPGRSEQEVIVDKLKLIEAETQRLEYNLEHKQMALRELKQSLLQKAFSGELTADRAEREAESATG